MDTVIADDRWRVTMPESIVPPGDISKDTMRRIILRRVEPTPEKIEKIPIAHIKIGKNGLPVVVLPKGVKVTRQMVARSVRQERENR